MPSIYCNHGAGDDNPGLFAPLIEIMRNLKTKPKAFVVISAHNVNDIVEITSGTNHGSKWKGHPQLSKKIESLLNSANIQSKMMGTKRWDFATTFPMKPMNP